MILGCKSEKTEYLCIDCECNSPEACEEFRKEAGTSQVVWQA